VTNAPGVSFIVPVYNYGRYLDDCLASIFGQSVEVPFEIVAIDDASTDDSLAVLDRWADPRLRVIRHAFNQGHARTFREGLELARGELVARIDPDDRYRTNFLARTLPVFAMHDEVDVVYGNAALIDAWGAVTQEQCVPRTTEEPEDILLDLLHTNFVLAPATIARRTAWLAVEPVPLWASFNDWYYTVMMAERGLFAYVDEVVADYRVHDSNHHSIIARIGTEEATARWIIESALARCEDDEQRRRAKQRARPKIVASHHLDSADKYFWFENRRAARRHYASALRRDPRLAFASPAGRRLASTALPADIYRRCRSFIKAIVPG
jgi:glycosyltransferase involved in cell wall biosynthesis